MKFPQLSGLEARGNLCDCFDNFVDGEDGGNCVETRENGRFGATLTMRSTAAPGVDIVAVVVGLPFCYFVTIIR